jgi:hypothetical protein
MARRYRIESMMDRQTCVYCRAMHGLVLTEDQAQYGPEIVCLNRAPPDNQIGCRCRLVAIEEDGDGTPSTEKDPT